MALPVKRCPKRFEEHQTLAGRDKHDEMEKYVKRTDFKNGEFILEHGCGSGNFALTNFAPIAEEKELTIYVVENSESMIEHAKEQYPHPRIHFIHGNLHSPDFALNHLKFDRMISIYFLNILATPYREELKAIYNLLKPGGEILIVLWHSTVLFAFLDMIKQHEHAAEHAEVKLIHNVLLGDHMPDLEWIADCFANPDGFKKETKKIGFAVSEWEVQNKSYTFEKLSQFADLMLSANSFAHHLEEEKLNELRGAYINYFKHTPTDKHTPHPDFTEDQEYIFDYETVNILLTKPE